jgi:glycosyltransferase involved in cell wall biosynthesis
MNTIIIFTIDSPLKNFGGLGESVKNLCYNLPEYNFITFGYGEQEQESKNNITHYKITSELNKEIEVDVENIKNILKDKYNIKLIHIFDCMYVNTVQELNKYLNVKCLYTCSLSSCQKILNIYNVLAPVFPEQSTKMLLKNKEKFETVKNKEQFVLNYASKVVFVSEYYKDLYKNNINSSKFTFIHNGINMEEYSVTIEKDKYKIPGKKGNTKILYIGRFDMMKNITALLETLLPEGFDLILAGSSKGGDLLWLEEFLEKNKLPNVYNVGFLYGDEKKYFLQNVDAVIVPSIHEPFGLVTLETIASKTILICSRSSGMREYISPEMCIDCGLFPATIYNSYITLKNMSMEEKEKMKDIAYESIKHLTWKNNAIKYKEIYDNF